LCITQILFGFVLVESNEHETQKSSALPLQSSQNPLLWRWKQQLSAVCWHLPTNLHTHIPYSHTANI